MTARIRIMVRSARRRVNAGEDIETILSNWTKLTEEEKQEIRDTI